MLTLSEETESLAQRLAEAQNLSVDAAVRGALEQQARSVGVTRPAESGRVSNEEIARRRAATEELQRQLDALPILDHRPWQEIADEINEL